MKKLKKLIEMLNAPKEICYRIEKIELNYNVASVLYSKYKTIFRSIFNCSKESFLNFVSSECNQDRPRLKTNVVNIKDLFSYGWLLFTYIRSKFKIFKINWILVWLRLTKNLNH